MQIIEPTLLLNKKQCLENLRMMLRKAQENKVIFRPHFKTHQSHEVASWFREVNVSCITVSSLKMAEYFVEDEWKDITVAFPLNTLEIGRINKIASIITLNLMAISANGVRELAGKLEYSIGLFIEIDTGYHRTGIAPYETNKINNILEEIKRSSLMKFKGFLSHAGHSYKTSSIKDIEEIHNNEMTVMKALKNLYIDTYPDLILSVGDTPTCSISNNFCEVDEIRPGNFIFYDIAQYKIGSCKLNQIAVVMACPVVAKYPERKEIVVYGGGVHFSKDFSLMDNGIVNYGLVVYLNNKGWKLPNTLMYVKSLSQEHGIIHAPENETALINEGDIIGILPVHSCLASDCMGEYLTLEGENIYRL